MPFVQVAITAMSLQIEDFPTEVPVEGKDESRAFKRSCEGSLHIRPGSSAEMTADELEHIKKTRPTLFSQLHVMATDEQLEASRAASTEPPPAPPAPVPDESSGRGGDALEDVSDEAPAAGKKSKR